MRTIRDYVGFILAFVLMIGCGSRSVSKTKEESSTEQKQEEKVKVKSEQVSDFKQVSNGTTEETGKRITANTKAEILTEIKDTQTENKISEGRKKQSSMRSYHKTYYPNGQLKSEKEITKETFEEITKLQQENAYLKSSAVALKEERDKLLEENKKLEISKDSLEKRDKQWKKVNNNLLKVEKNNQEILNRQADREAYPWYWWVIGAVIVWEFLKLLWRNYFKYLIKIR